jgi:hypothetical protein
LVHRVLFVADQFSDTARDSISRYPGGAELTDEAVIQASPWPVERVNITKLRPHHLADFNLHVLGNLHNATQDQCDAFARSGRHVLFEHDYRICLWRGDFEESNSTYHRRFWLCNCRQQKWGGAFKTALGAIFLTHRQLNVYKSNPFVKLPQHVVLGCSVMGEAFFEAVRRYQEAGAPAGRGTCVMYSGHLIKGFQEALQYCRERGIEPRIVRDVSPAEVLCELAAAERLVFLPRWVEPASRLAIEARFLGCDIISNEALGVGGEAWWHAPDEVAFPIVRDAPARFWRAVDGFFTSRRPARYSWLPASSKATLVHARGTAEEPRPTPGEPS